MSTNQTETPAVETLEVDDLDMFIRLLLQWHTRKVATLEHFLNIPQGIEINFNNEGDRILEGDLHKGFIIGINTALMEMGTLPFVARIEEEDAAPAAANELQ